jgi:primary-amine oxidase
VLAVNHHHLFNIHIHPAIDGHRNTVVYEDIVAASEDPKAGSFGVAFKVKEITTKKAGGFPLNLETSRFYKIQSPFVINEISNMPVLYKLHAMPP